ncbi:TPA: type VI secretion system contractile sheath small subunit [Escherichia coli]|uniref:type VI secretion system contractile sheath small subunit n=1 Tax=Escherichia fergusonii TaxID=564 RepID=UPI0015F5BC0E|nr:type VI secretion system contractile sheath small subunit [Escherichia fergusonii]EIH3908519.1 type VI secretion system contractile sheath small subunit [Escherichia coli]EIY2762615.1 type VI secretion system contractile sheath small subunit [Escherichia coli]EKM4468911.1 type VI secretion system contractile sheath small subunit [Escherichia coli]MBA8501318.1 type VI secretion system contractile sheath small subunit [Escherichia fergusonii]MCH5361443.1 type VI secretion system contractile s
MSSRRNDGGGSIAPKERVNIKFKPKTGNQTAEVELPLNLLVTGNLTGDAVDTPLDERQPVAINRNNFNAVLDQAGIGRDFTVPSALSETPDTRMSVNLKIRSLADLSPDNIASQVPEMRKMLELREALVALRGPMGNIPAFRAQLQALLEDEKSREQLIAELGLAGRK